MLLLHAMAVVAFAGEPRTQAGDTTPTASTESVAALEARIAELVNAHRSEEGKSALERRSELDAIARGHSQAMAAGVVGLGHEGMQARSVEIKRTVAMKQFAENVWTHNQVPLDDMPPVALETWLASSGHRRNLEGDYRLTGVGAAVAADGGVYVTQVFVLQRPAAADVAAPPPAPAN